jgi:NADPH:quinone reductase-like Zn-dependent oxidoreductase
MKAVKVTSDVDLNTLAVSEIAKPKPGASEVLIKNQYVASNPKDWKLHDSTYVKGPDLVEGNDVAGYVEAVGDQVTRVKVGDRVAGFSIMLADDKYGAYAEYTVVPEHTTFKLADSVNLDEAVTLPLASMTAAINLFRKLDLPEPKEPAEKGKIAVFINGGSTSVGHFAVQLAKASRLYVITTAGAASQLPKDAGADVVLDYRGKSAEELAKEVRKAADDAGVTLDRVFDTVSDGTHSLVAAVLGDKAGSKAAFILPIPEGADKNTAATFSRSSVGAAHGRDGDHSAFATEYYDWMAEGLAKGTFKGNPVKLMPKGLASVGEGLALLKQNKVSGQKIVYKIADTP